MNLTVTQESVLTFLMRKVGKDAEYKAAMESYLSRPAYLLSDPSQKYPQRETLYDRDIMLR